MARNRNTHSSFNIYWPTIVGIKLAHHLFVLFFFFRVAQISTQACVLIKERQKLLIRITSVLLFISSLFSHCFSWSHEGHVYIACNLSKVKMHALLKFILSNSLQWGSRTMLKNGLPVNELQQSMQSGYPFLLQEIFPTQDWTQVSRIAGRFLTSWATREAQQMPKGGITTSTR